jgi:hypothetical protein
MSSPIHILHIGLEGGGGWLMGDPTHGKTVYWFTGSQMGLDENDNETWCEFKTEQTENIEEALPKGWRNFFPLEVHPQYIECIRDHFYRSKPSIGRNTTTWNEILHSRIHTSV